MEINAEYTIIPDKEGYTENRLVALMIINIKTIKQYNKKKLCKDYKRDMNGIFLPNNNTSIYYIFT